MHQHFWTFKTIKFVGSTNSSPYLLLVDIFKSWSVRLKILSKDGVDEWTALLESIVEKYPILRATIVKYTKVCVDNNQKLREQPNHGR
jgi:hypothetical protein